MPPRNQTRRRQNRRTGPSRAEYNQLFSIIDGLEEEMDRLRELLRMSDGNTDEAKEQIHKNIQKIRERQQRYMRRVIPNGIASLSSRR